MRLRHTQQQFKPRLDNFWQRNCDEQSWWGILWFPACSYLSIADATIGAMLTNDRGLGLFELEFSGDPVEKESLTPLDDTRHLIVTHLLRSALTYQQKYLAQLAAHALNTMTE